MAEDKFKFRREHHHTGDSDVPSQHNRCRGKKSYPSKRHAKAIVRQMRALHPGTTAALQEYKCKDCRRWHVGNDNRPWWQREES